MAPDMSADTGLGASGWARGSHTCSGTAPAFDAKPASARTNASGADRGRDPGGAGADRGEGLAAGVRAEQDEREQDRGGPGVGHHRVPLGRVPGLGAGGAR